MGIEILLLLVRGAVMGVGALLGRKAWDRGHEAVRRRRSNNAASP